MKRMSLFAVLLSVAPALALAQTPPPPPPAPPAPMAVPPSPPPTPLPPLAPSVVIPSIVDPIALADVMRAAEMASTANWVDAQAIRDAAMAAASSSYRLGAMAPVQAMADMQWRLAADMQNSQLVTYAGSSDYNNGMSAMNRRQYDEAITRFDRVINTKSTKADGALYWKAWCQAKLGKADEAVATLAILKKDHSQSLYLKDARALEADVKKLGPNQVDDEDIKLLAIQGIQNQNPDVAIPALEGVLSNPTNSQRYRSQALYVLATNDQPKAHQILLSYAKGGGNPDLQLSAIGYLANRGQKTSSAELIDIYNSSANTDVRLAVIRAFRSAGAKGPLMAIASGNGFGPTMVSAGGRGGAVSSTSSSSSNTVTRGGGAGGRGAGAGAGAGSSDVTAAQLAALAERRIAISGLTDLASPQELWPLYQKEENKDLRLEWVSTFAAMGATDQLMQIVNTEKDSSVRLRAVRSLGNVPADKAGPVLTSMYASGDKETKSAVITALGNQNNAESLVTLARKETDQELRRQIVERLANMAKSSKVAMDYLMELINGKGGK